MISKCIICSRYHNTKIDFVHQIISEFFSVNDFYKEQQLKFIQLIKRDYELFCKDCIKYGLIFEDYDKDKRVNRLQVIIKYYNMYKY